MEKFLENEQIILLNSGESTRNNADHNFFSAIDLTVSNSAFAPITEWNVFTEYSTSDYWLISIKILNEPTKIHPPSQWCLKNSNWNLYNDIITQNLNDKPIDLELTSNQIQINLIIDQFCHIILESAIKTIGRTNLQLKK
jgi:hypothetical protein